MVLDDRKFLACLTCSSWRFLGQSWEYIALCATFRTCHSLHSFIGNQPNLRIESINWKCWWKHFIYEGFFETEISDTSATWNIFKRFISVECRSICRPIYRSWGTQITHDPQNCHTVSYVIIYMKKFLDCDWLREMQFLDNTM